MPDPSAKLELVVDVLLSEYHKAIVAGLALSCALSAAHRPLVACQHKPRKAKCQQPEGSARKARKKAPSAVSDPRKSGAGR